VSLPKVDSQSFPDVHLVGMVWCLWKSGYAETSQVFTLASGEHHWRGKGPILAVGLAGLQAVVEAAEETIEQVALRRGVPVAHTAAAVVVSSGARWQTEGGETQRIWPPLWRHRGEPHGKRRTWRTMNGISLAREVPRSGTQKLPI